MLIAVVLVMAMNIGIDPYGLFGVGPLRPGPFTNQRYHHIRALTSQPERFNVLLMGTSVMGINAPASVDQAVPGAKTYNMGFFLATATDLLTAARHLQKAGALPHNVIVGVDLFLFAPREEPLQLEFRFPPGVSGDNHLAWWVDAAFAPSLWQSANKVIDATRPLASVALDDVAGSYQLPMAEALRLNDPIEHARRAFKPPPATLPSDHILERELEALGALRDFFEQQGTNVLWVIQPNSTVLRTALGTARYQAQMRLIRERLPDNLVDFSDLPGMTDDPMMWYDLKHYARPAGAKLLATALEHSPAFVQELRLSVRN